MDYIHKTVFEQLRYKVATMKKADLVSVIFRMYAHIMGEVEVEGLSYLEGIEIKLRAMKSLRTRVKHAIQAAEMVGDPVNADLIFMCEHVECECSCCKVCYDRYEHGCSACDGSNDMYA